MSRKKRNGIPTDYFDLQGGNIFKVKNRTYIKIKGGPDTGAVHIKDGEVVFFGDSCRIEYIGSAIIKGIAKP